MMPQDIPTTFYGCGKRFLIDQALSCPKCCLILAWNDDAANEWGALGSRALIPSAITYEHKINIMTVQGERTRARARQVEGTADGGADIVG